MSGAPRPIRARSGLLLRRILATALPLLFLACEEAPGRSDSAPELALILEGVGCEHPVAAFYDPKRDSYLIANLGDPNAPERYGFISRVSPRGKVSDLNWIDGRAAGTTLHTPTGLEVQGDTLYVADAGSVRLFHRISGSTRGALEVESAIALRDLTLGPGSMPLPAESDRDRDHPRRPRRPLLLKGSAVPDRAAPNTERSGASARCAGPGTRRNSRRPVSGIERGCRRGLPDS